MTTGTSHSLGKAAAVGDGELGRPARQQRQLALTGTTQPGVAGEHLSCVRGGRLAGCGLGKICVIPRVILLGSVTAHFPADCRWCPTQASGDLAESMTTLAKRRDPLAFQ